MLLAADDSHASRIERLILNDVGPALNGEGLVKLSSYFAIPHRFSTFGELSRELKHHYASFGIDDESAWRELALNSSRRLPDGSWTYHFDPRIAEQFVHDTPRDTWANWANIRCPLMVIRGESSSLLDADTLLHMREAQPDLVCLTVPGCGHAPMLDRASQVAPVADFLARPARRHGTPSIGRPVMSIWQRLWHWLRR